jgi:hypothetical protein
VAVEFFSREGHRIGDKAALEQLLHHRTSIPLAALRNTPLDQFSTSERLRWAENRTTTEEEDIVYCLLGLLGISMPITYGEGQESARRRLQAEIDATGSAPSSIPFSRNESFVGRMSQLAKLEAKLFSNNQTATTLAIVGLGGTGKSQLALEVAHRTRLKNKNCLVFWMDASDIDSLYRSYASVARKLSISGYDDDQVDIKQVAKRCIAAIRARQCLLIYDNIGGTTLLPSGSSTTQAADLVNFLPHSKLCSVIFTTTESNIAEALAPQNVTTLHELTPDSALRMLQNRLTTPLSNAEQQDAMHLLRELLYLPLAIVQAAACMNAGGITVQQYQAQLVGHKEAALKYSDDPSKGEQRELGLRNTVAATLSLSMSQVRYSNAVAADYLFLAACVDRKDILLNLLEAASPRTREDAIKVLDRYALVTRRPAESALDVHRLVHYALRKRLQAEGRLQEWMRSTVTQLLRLFPNYNHLDRSKCRRLLPHAQCVLSYTQEIDDEERLDLAWKCARALYSDGQYKGAEDLQVQVMQTRKRVLGDEHPDTLTIMNDLASTYWNQGRWRETEELQVQVIQARKRVLGDTHSDTLMIINDLATTYRNQGRWGKAEELDVEEARKRVLGNKHLHTLSSIKTYWHQGRWGEAEGPQAQVMEKRRVLSDKHLHTVTRDQGRWSKVEELQTQVIETTKRELGDEHPHTLSSIAHLASTYRDQGRWGKAEELQTQVMQARKRVLGDEHLHTLSSIAHLASTYWHQGQWDKAEGLQAQVTETTKRVLGDEHPHTLSSIAHLASTYRDQGRWGKAEELQAQVMQARERVLGNEHPHMLTSMNDLALTYWHQGRYNKAEELQAQVIETRKRVLGDKHPHTLISMHNLAYTLRSQSRRIEALALIEMCFQLRQEVLGEHHPDTQLSLQALNGWQGNAREEQ